MNAATLQSTLYRGHSGFEAIAGDWETLTGGIRSKCFYHHPYWFRAFFEASPAAGDRIDFVGIHRGTELKAVFPVTCNRERVGGTAVVDLPLDNELLYMADCAISDDENGADIYDCFRQSLRKVAGGRWDVYRARDVLRDGHLGRAVSGHRRPGKTIYTEKLCAEIRVGEYDEAIRKLKKKFRGNLNNAKSKLDRAGEAVFTVDRSADGVRKLFETFVELEMSGWKGQPDNLRNDRSRPSAIGLKKRKLDFYRTVVNLFAQAGNVEISNLLLDDKLIGAQICLLLDETSYLLKVAYDEDAGRYSPGQLLIDYALRRYAEEGKIKRYNLITDYRWFDGWNPEYREYLMVRDFNRTARGAAGFLRSRIGAKKRDYYSNRASGKTA